MPDERARRAAYDKKHRKRITAYQRERLRTNPVAACIDRLRKRLWKSLWCASKHAGHKLSKAASTLELIGCSPNELIEHLGRKLWEQRHEMNLHIDHIWPVSMYDMADEDEQYRCFNWRNLRLAYSFENCQKGARPPSPSLGILVPEDYRPGGGATDRVKRDVRLQLTKEEAESIAKDEGLSFKLNRHGWYKGVEKSKRRELTKPFAARSQRGRVKIHLGYFAVAEHAALVYARFQKSTPPPKRIGSSRRGIKWRRSSKNAQKPAL